MIASTGVLYLEVASDSSAVHTGRGGKVIGNVIIENVEEFDIPEDFILFQSSIFASTQKTFPVVCCSLYV